MLRDLHMHTSYCDGTNSPEEMILKAIDLKLECVGILFHSYTFYDQSYCIKKENIKIFIDEVLQLKEKYKDKIRVLLGIEQDFYAEKYPFEFDYVIGSVHYIKKNDKYISIDDSKEDFINIANTYYNGDYYKLAEDYFETVSLVAEKLNPDIIAHIDLITKFNEGNLLFDQNHERYVKACKKAVDKLVKYNIPFEINMGAISRGYKKEPYPSISILEYIYQKGGKVVLSSDAHKKDYIAFDFDKWALKAKEIGFEI